MTAAAILAARDLLRIYGRTRAVDGVSIDLHPGTVHALVGENGAGKSTLLKLLAGAERPQSGTMNLHGEPFAPRDLPEASARGVSLVFQEITINRALSVAENVFIDRLRRFTRLGLVDRRSLDRAAQAILDRLGADVSVAADLDRLNLGQWKCIEIARALSQEPKLLFLDESTAYLDHREVAAVLRAIAQLKAEGLTIAFVSHHLDEVRAVADRLTILKDGREAGTFAADEIGPDEIHHRMVGRDLSSGIYPSRGSPIATGQGASALFEAEAVAVKGELESASFAVAKGSIVGIAELKGAGGEALLYAIAGAKGASGAMRLEGRLYAPADPAEAWRRGVAYLPGDRSAEGLIVDFSVLDNLIMARPPRRGIFLDRAAAHALAERMVASIGVRTSGVDAPCRSLSGGNLQKVVLGKCLATAPRLLLLNNPTRGVDVGARLEIYRTIRKLADEGMGVILLSEDLPELIGLADQVTVLKRGCVAQVFDTTENLSEHDIVRHMT
jgi:ABC-type sugar transport system ATPase subunit